MSVSSISGSQAVAQTMRTAFKPPSFSSLDANSDSSLSLEELVSSASKGASKTQNSQQAEALFKAMDSDSDGSVTSTEKDAFDTQMATQAQAMAFMTQQLSGPSNADVFSATDTDGDGAVSLDEFGNDEAAADISSDALQQLFDLIDADGSGSITEGESSDFLDAVKTAMGDGQPAGGPPPGGPPPGASASSDEDDDATDDTTLTTGLLSMAQNAYKQTQQQSLLDQLVSIFDSAA